MKKGVDTDIGLREGLRAQDSMEYAFHCICGASTKENARGRIAAAGVPGNWFEYPDQLVPRVSM